MTNLSMLTAAIGILSVLHPAAASDLVRDPYAAVREESSSPATTTLLVTKTATLARSTGGPRVDIMSVDVETGSSEDVDSVIARLLESGGIESVELDRPAKLVQEQQLERTNLPNDPDYEAQWHLPFINAPVAWAIATGSSDVKVCLIDSGVERSHTDLNYNLEHFKGDHAYRNSSRDATGHGTHMAGIIAAKGSNAFEVTGVNWNANLISCRFVQENGSGMVSDAINCMYWCEKQGAKIINNSWTTNYRMDALAKSMEDLGTRGVLFVSAAANQGVNLGEEVDHFPAGFNELDNQLVVGALEPDGTLAPYSNYGTAFVHIAAPGSNILSLSPDGGLSRKSGTSCSAPMVTGTIALMADAARTEISAIRLKDILLNSYRYEPNIEGQIQGGRVLDTGKAVRAARQSYVAKMIEAGREADIL